MKQLSKEEQDTVMHRLARNRTCRPKLTPAQRVQLVKDYAAKDVPSLAALAERYGVTTQTVRYHLRRATSGARYFA